MLIATRMGAFFLRGDKTRRTWKLSDPIFLGHIVHHVVLDPRDGLTLLMAARTGHLGPTVFRSTDLGKTWKEAGRPTAFPKAPEGEKGLVLDHVFWLTPGHARQPDVWYAGSSPQGLFRSEDGGRTWEGVSGFNEHPMRSQWTGAILAFASASLTSRTASASTSKYLPTKNRCTISARRQNRATRFT